MELSVVDLVGLLAQLVVCHTVNPEVSFSFSPFSQLGGGGGKRRRKNRRKKSSWVLLNHQTLILQICSHFKQTIRIIKINCTAWGWIHLKWLLLVVCTEKTTGSLTLGKTLSELLPEDKALSLPQSNKLTRCVQQKFCFSSTLQLKIDFFDTATLKETWIDVAYHIHLNLGSYWSVDLDATR